MKDSIEFYLNDSLRPFLIINSSFQPEEGDLVNINNITYKVIGRSFTIDYSETPGRAIRCNLIVDTLK